MKFKQFKHVRNFAGAVLFSICLDYYDKAYLHDHNKREAVKVQKVHCAHGDARENAEIILKMLQKKGIKNPVNDASFTG